MGNLYGDKEAKSNDSQVNDILTKFSSTNFPLRLHQRARGLASHLRATPAVGGGREENPGASAPANSLV